MNAAALPNAYAHDPFLALQHVLSTPWLDPFMVAATWVCQGWVLALLAVAITSLAERRHPRGWLLALPVLAALAIDGAAVQWLKHAFDLPRPLAVLGADEVRVLIEPLRAHSMPSGHASSAAALAAYEIPRHRRAGLAVAALAAVGGISRVYVGAHWALDVVVGWLLGAMIGAAAAVLARAVARRLARPAPVLAAPAQAPSAR